MSCQTVKIIQVAGGGGVGDNFVSADLAATQNRTHNMGGNQLTISNATPLVLQSVANALLTLDANATLDAGTGVLTITSSNGTYVIGDGTVGSLPTLDSDTGDDILSVANPSGSLTRKAIDSVINVNGVGAPVDGTTTAWYVGQIYINQTTNEIWIATAKSTNPDVAATGSTWVQTAAIPTPFEQTFDATTDWGAAAGGFYEITITQATHTKTVISSIQVWEGTTEFDLVTPDRVRVNVAGDVLFRVAETPDNRFAGKIVIA